MVNIGNSWDSLLAEEFKKPYYLKLREFLKEQYKNFTVYPDKHDIFNALRYTDYNDVRVVILGQDPYHQPNQAHGLAFSVREGVPPPPSLQNIFKEIHSDSGCPIPSTGCLIPWTRQGVLLLNTVLTVRASTPNSHKNMGWEIFTNRIIELLNNRSSPIVFLLWGANARAKSALITNPAHLVLTAPHPSPLSAYHGFFNCRHFSQTNNFLLQNNLPAIDWAI